MTKRFRTVGGKRISVSVSGSEVRIDLLDTLFESEMNALLDPNTARFLGLALIRAAGMTKESE